MADWKPGPVYVAIAKALVLESGGDEPQAIRTLESAVARNVRTVATPEAQIELARLLARAGRVEEAKQQLASAEDLLSRETKIEMLKDEAAPYFAAIQKTRDNLKFDANPGLAEIEQADKLRADGKFAEAGKLYEQVIAQWPKSESADRATVGAGYCLAGLGKTPAAIDLWRKFLTSGPSARWRAQAFVGLLDSGLEGQFPWPDTQKTAAWAESSLPAALADEKAKPSWQQAAYPLYLQLGTIAWISGKYDSAASSLDQCVKLSDGERAKQLSSLVEVVKQKRSLLPEGVVQATKAGQMDPASVALSMSVIKALGEQYDSSRHFADLVAAGSIAATPHQRAFATFLQICIDDTAGPVASTASSSETPNPQISNPKSNPRNSNPQSPALTIDQRYHELTKACPDAPWLDEVFYRLAARNDKTAEKATDTDPLNLNAPSRQAAPGRPSSPPTSDGKPAPAKADGDLFAFTESELPPVLTAYRTVIDTYPKSPRRERCLWRVGRICLDTGRADEADQVFGAQYQAYPQGPYAGDALVRLIDVALEYRFDLATAKKLADGAVQWAAAAHKVLPDTATLDPWRTLGHLPNLPVDEWVEYELYLRAGFLAYLNEDFATAKALFEKGSPANPQPGRPVSAETSGISLLLMQKACEKQWVPWDGRAVDACKTDAQRVGIKLADCYIYGARSDRGLAIYQRIMGKDPSFMPLTGDLEAYATWKLALAYAEGPGNIAKAMELYGRFYHPPLNKSPWVPDAVLRLGVLVFNNTGRSAESMKHYQHVFTRYPDHPLAEKAMYFYCIEAIGTKDHVLARKAVEQFVSRYAASPESDWRQHVINNLKDLEKQSPDKAQ